MSAAVHLHERFPELASGALGHVRLGTSPTPVRRVGGLGTGGAEVWIKDEGAYGDGGWGGNKVRKLEWLLPEAHRRGAHTVIDRSSASNAVRYVPIAPTGIGRTVRDARLHNHRR